MPRKTTPNVSTARIEFTTYRFRQSQSASVKYGNVSLLRRFEVAVNDCQVGSLRPGHVEDFFYGDEGLHLSCGRTTLGKYRQDLKGFLSWCHRREWLPLSGDAMVEGIAHKGTHTNRDRTRLTAPELLHFMDCAEEPRDRALIAFVANTGVRISEALGLKLRDVRLDRGEVYVTLYKTREEHTYYITADLDRELRTWLTAYAVAMGEEPRPEWRLFPARQRGGFRAEGETLDHMELPRRQRPRYKPLHRINNPVQILHKVNETAGLDFELGDGWHTIRRSIARVFFDRANAQGRDAALRMTQSLLKHKNAATTEIYLGLNHEAAQVQEALQGKPFLSAIAEESPNNVVPIREGA